MDIIWIHGFGEDSSIWEGFLSKIKDSHNHYLFDFSGTIGHDSIKNYADDLNSFVKDNSISNPVLIGHSMGGYIALEYAFQNHNTVRGLGLFHSSASGDSEVKKAERDKTISFIRKNGSEVFIKNFYPNMFSEISKETYSNLIAQNIEKFEKLNQDALCSATESMKNRKDYVKSLSHFNFPIFQILGKKDSFVPLASALNQTILLQKPYTLVLDNVAHAGMYEAAEVCSDFINYFLADVPK